MCDPEKTREFSAKLDSLIDRVWFLKEQNLANESLWQRLLEYMVVFYYQIIDGERRMHPFAQHTSLYYPSATASNMYMVPHIFQLGDEFGNSPAIRSVEDSALGDDFYNVLQLINVPRTVQSTIGSGALLYKMGYYVIRDVDAIIMGDKMQFKQVHEDRLDIVQLLNKLFSYCAVHECHPRDLVVALYQGRYLEENQRLVWQDFLLTDMYYNMGLEGHAFSQAEFIERVCIEAPRRSLREDEGYIRSYFYAIQRLMLDQVVVLSEVVVTQASIESAYEAIRYEHKKGRGPVGTFVGFDLMKLHTKLLGYWWHNGILSVEGCVDQICYGLQYRLQIAMESCKDLCRQWMEYIVTLLEKTEKFIKHVRETRLMDYEVADASRVSLIAWESVLKYLDDLVVTETPHPYLDHHTSKMLDNMMDLFVRYHTTVHYPTSCSLEMLYGSDDHEGPYGELFCVHFPYREEKQVEEPVKKPVVASVEVPSQRHQHDEVMQTLLDNQREMARMMEQMRTEMGNLRVAVRAKDDEISRLQESTYQSTQQLSATAVAVMEAVPSRYDDEYNRYAKKMDKSAAMEAHIDAFNVGIGKEATMYPVIPVSRITGIPLVTVYEESRNGDRSRGMLMNDTMAAEKNGILMQSDAFNKVHEVVSKKKEDVDNQGRKRIQPTLISGRDVSKKEHFPKELHAYFTESGAYPVEWPAFVVNYMDRFIYKHCYQGGKIVSIPIMEEKLLEEIKRWQIQQLIQCGANEKKPYPFVLPGPMMEILCMYMCERFIIVPSTIPHAGQGLFLKPGVEISEDLRLPYTGDIVSSAELIDKDDDKVLCMRDELYVRGSSQMRFEITGNIYANYMSKCNERVSQDVVRSNHGSFTDSGMVEMTRMSTMNSKEPMEVTILYVTIPTTIAELKTDMIHREFLRRGALEKLWEVLDSVMQSLNLPWYVMSQSTIHQLIYQVLDGEVTFNEYRHEKLMRNPCQRFVQACVAVVDGRFKQYLKNSFPLDIYASFQSGRSKKMYMSIDNMPEMMLVHMHTQFFFCNYLDDKIQKRVSRYNTQNYRLIARVMKECGEIITNSKLVTRIIQVKYGVSGFEYMKVRIAHENDANEEMEPKEKEVQGYLSMKSEDPLDMMQPEQEKCVIADGLLKSVKSIDRITGSVSEPSTPLTNENSHSNVESRTIRRSDVDDSSPIQGTFQRSSVKGDQVVNSVNSRVTYRDHSNEREIPSIGTSVSGKSYETEEITDSMKGMVSSVGSYNPRTLPNTKAEAVKWLGVSDLPYEAYLSVPGGRLCQHELVANLMDVNGSSRVYNSTQTLMMMLAPYNVDLSYHRVDIAKKEFGLNDRTKVAVFDQKYDGHQCLYEHTNKLLTHYSYHRYPYVHLYDVLSKGTDLSGNAWDQWQSYIRSSNMSLVKDDVTNSILLSQAPQSFQMRDIAELIVDLVVFRVLIFGKLKSKVSVRNELQGRKLVSKLPGVHYDGILQLVQYAIHMSRLFVDEDNAVQDLVNTIVRNVSKTSPDHSMLAVDLNANLSREIRLYRDENRQKLESVSQREATLSIFSCIERYCRQLQTVVRQTLTSCMETETVKSPTPSSPNSYNRDHRRPGQYSVSPSSTYPHTAFKKAQVHAAQVNVAQINVEPTIDPVESSGMMSDIHFGAVSDAYLYDKSSDEPIDEVVMAELEGIHRDGKARALRAFYREPDYSRLPEGAVILPSRELEGSPTIHIHMVKATGEGLGEVRMLDTKCSVEPRWQGICTLCGKKGHDQGHCRIRGYNIGPNGEVMANLAAWSYFADDKLAEEMGYAIENGFLKNTTLAEQNWVKQTVARLRSERFLLYQSKAQGFGGARQQYSQSRSPSPYGARQGFKDGFKDENGYGQGDKSSSL